MFLPFSSATMINYSDGAEMLCEYCSSNDIVSIHALIRQICDDKYLLSLLTGTKGVLTEPGKGGSYIYIIYMGSPLPQLSQFTRGIGRFFRSRQEGSIP